MKLNYFVIFVGLVATPHLTMVLAQTVTNITDALDEITDEIGDMQKGDGQNTTAGQRTVVSDIDKLKKIAQILETVGQALLPTVVDGQVNAQNAESNSVKATVSSEPVKILPTGLKLLQHHSALASNLNDSPPVQSPLTADVPQID